MTPEEVHTAERLLAELTGVVKRLNAFTSCTELSVSVKEGDMYHYPVSFGHMTHVGERTNYPTAEEKLAKSIADDVKAILIAAYQDRRYAIHSQLREMGVDASA